MRSQVTEAIEPARQAGQIGKSLDATVTLHAPASAASTRVLEQHRALLPELFIVSRVELRAQETDSLQIGVTHCKEHGDQRCPRC